MRPRAVSRSARVGWTMNSKLLAIISLLIILSAPTVVTAQQQNLAQRVEQAAALIGENRLAEAEEQLNYVLQRAPNEAGALNLLGALRAKQGRLDEAETLFTRAVRADPQLVGAHMNLAYLYVLKRAPDQTIAELKEVVRLDPDNTDARGKLAHLLLAQGRTDECIALLNEWQQARTLPGALTVVLGDAYLSKHDLDRAEQSYLLANNAQGDAPDALLGLALVAQKK